IAAPLVVDPVAEDRPLRMVVAVQRGALGTQGLPEQVAADQQQPEQQRTDATPPFGQALPAAGDREGESLHAVALCVTASRARPRSWPCSVTRCMTVGQCGDWLGGRPSSKCKVAN